VTKRMGKSTAAIWKRNQYKKPAKQTKALKSAPAVGKVDPTPSALRIAVMRHRVMDLTPNDTLDLLIFVEKVLDVDLIQGQGIGNAKLKKLLDDLDDDDMTGSRCWPLSKRITIKDVRAIVGLLGEG
jgi:hypothetical protein